MKEKNLKHLALFIDKDLHSRFYFVAKSDDRSMNWLLIQLVRRCVCEYEETNGTITENELKEFENKKQRT